MTSLKCSKSNSPERRDQVGAFINSKNQTDMNNKFFSELTKEELATLIEGLVEYDYFCSITRCKVIPDSIERDGNVIFARFDWQKDATPVDPADSGTTPLLINDEGHILTPHDWQAPFIPKTMQEAAAETDLRYWSDNKGRHPMMWMASDDVTTGRKSITNYI